MRAEKFKIRRSVRRQFAMIFIGLMAGTIFLCWTINIFFLEPYYIRSKTKVIFQAYNSIHQAADNDTYHTDEFRLELDEVCGIYNITVYVINVNSGVIYASRNGGEELERRLLAYLFGYISATGKVLEEGEGYMIQLVRVGEDEYLEMHGRLESGISFIMRTPVESIRESVKVANRFLAYIGITATLAGGVIIWFVAGKITKPILELNSISEKMVHLDFEAKYAGGAHNEIDLLGENINKLSASLEESISELKTANNELQKDIEKKEQMDEMRKEFLANVSHELKTPIALIQGYAEGLSEGVSDDPESREFYCDVIIDEAAKMNQMVKNLLTLNQLEFGDEDIVFERFNLTELVKGVLQSMEILAEQEGIRVIYQQVENVYVWADEFKVEQVVRNYVSNAFHHVDKEKVVEVKIQTKESKARVTVFNTGMPIADEDIRHIWEKFYKADKAHTREYGGNGIGLSIVKAIMESFHQKYGVNNYDNGVEFWFELDVQ